MSDEKIGIGGWPRQGQVRPFIENSAISIGRIYREGTGLSLLRRWLSAAEAASATFPARIATLLVVLAILYWRTPITFTNPQFWAEDGIFYAFAMNDGWASLGKIIAGYLTVIQLLVAVLVSYFDPVWAPTLFNYTAVALTLLCAWIVTSPRLDLPAKPLLAIAPVIGPMGYEEVGTMCNVQWILPVGAFALPFTRPAASRWILIAEAVFIALTSLSGPFSILMAPLFIWRVYATRDAERHRLVILTAIVVVSAIIQLGLMATHPAMVNAPAPYDVTLWANLPMKQIAAAFGPPYFWFQGPTGVWISIACVAAAAALSFVGPYRSQKLFMLYLGLVIAYAGMLKFRDSLASLEAASRYFYAGGVFAMWFICCLTIRLRYVAFAVVLYCQIQLVPLIANTPRDRIDYEWKKWALTIRPDKTTHIPISPAGWSITILAKR
ncbi:MAG: hypothetical protein ABW151_10645 [Pseudorhodoplanes sp.]